MTLASFYEFFLSILLLFLLSCRMRMSPMHGTACLHSLTGTGSCCERHRSLSPAFPAIVGLRSAMPALHSPTAICSTRSTSSRFVPASLTAPSPISPYPLTPIAPCSPSLISLSLHLLPSPHTPSSPTQKPSELLCHARYEFLHFVIASPLSVPRRTPTHVKLTRAFLL